MKVIADHQQDLQSLAFTLPQHIDQLRLLQFLVRVELLLKLINYDQQFAVPSGTRSSKTSKRIGQ